MTVDSGVGAVIAGLGGRGVHEGDHREAAPSWRDPLSWRLLESRPCISLQ